MTSVPLVLPPKPDFIERFNHRDKRCSCYFNIPKECALIVYEQATNATTLESIALLMTPEEPSPSDTTAHYEYGCSCNNRNKRSNCIFIQYKLHQQLQTHLQQNTESRDSNPSSVKTSINEGSSVKTQTQNHGTQTQVDVIKEEPVESKLDREGTQDVDNDLTQFVDKLERNNIDLQIKCETYKKILATIEKMPKVPKVEPTYDFKDSVFVSIDDLVLEIHELKGYVNLLEKENKTLHDQCDTLKSMDLATRTIYPRNNDSMPGSYRICPGVETKLASTDTPKPKVSGGTKVTETKLPNASTSTPKTVKKRVTFAETNPKPIEQESETIRNLQQHKIQNTKHQLVSATDKVVCMVSGGLSKSQKRNSRKQARLARQSYFNLINSENKSPHVSTSTLKTVEKHVTSSKNPIPTNQGSPKSTMTSRKTSLKPKDHQANQPKRPSTLKPENRGSPKSTVTPRKLTSKPKEPKVVTQPEKSVFPSNKVYSSYKTKTYRPFLETTYGKDGKVTGFYDQYGWFPHKPKKPTIRSGKTPHAKIDIVSKPKHEMIFKQVSNKKWTNKTDLTPSSTSSTKSIKYSSKELLLLKPQSVIMAKTNDFPLSSIPHELLSKDTPCNKSKWNAMSISQIDNAYKWLSKTFSK